jgi:ATP-dependent exoDNAse (exonuclease V) alpha subunit
MLAAHGQAITVHKSQGSEYDAVGFVVDWASRQLGARDPTMARRLVYTALTRSRKRVVVFDID